MQQTRAKTTARDTWTVYQMLFTDHLEAVNAAPRTLETYGLAIEQLGAFLRAQGMPLDPTRVTREHLEEWLRYLMRPAADGGKGVSATTANQRYRSISRFFGWLVETDEIAATPMLKMHPPKVPERLVPVIGDDDLARLFKGVAGTDFESRRDKAIISLFVDCGLRIGEMAGINLDHLDLDERDVVVTGKGRRPRRIRFVRETRSDIQRYLLKRVDHPHAEDSALWIGKRGRLTVSGIYRMVVRRCQDAGLAPVHPHMFRHTFAHQYLRAGGNEGDLMKVTGWTSREMVTRYGASAAASRAADAHDTFSPRKLVK
ncbi:MAG TPA: tyrosine-type recombinase/integrase [Dehalococcoidia bacterium]|nr:tyrosine-type recombinase/integrase [Dehalococcoidia bacterium]